MYRFYLQNQTNEIVASRIWYVNKIYLFYFALEIGTLRRGLAMRTAIIVWSILDGEFASEFLNAKHCTPFWQDARRKRMRMFECRYKYAQEMRVERGRSKKVVSFWYRRIITETDDIPDPDDDDSILNSLP